MASTSLTLGKHWEIYIQELIKTGRYASASEVVRDSLRLHQEKEAKLENLQKLLQDGIDSGDAGELNMDEIKREAREYAKRKQKSENKKKHTG